jgi:hypothetical protein
MGRTNHCVSTPSIKRGLLFRGGVNTRFPRNYTGHGIDASQEKALNVDHVQTGCGMPGGSGAHPHYNIEYRVHEMPRWSLMYGVELNSDYYIRHRTRTCVNSLF